MHPPAYRSDEFTVTAIYSYLHLSTPKTPLRPFPLRCAIWLFAICHLRAHQILSAPIHESTNPTIHESLASVRSHSPLFAPKKWDPPGTRARLNLTKSE